MHIDPHVLLTPLPCRRGECKEEVTKLLGDTSRVFTTKCVMQELRSLGKEYSGVMMKRCGPPALHVCHGWPSLKAVQAWCSPSLLLFNAQILGTFAKDMPYTTAATRMPSLQQSAWQRKWVLATASISLWPPKTRPCTGRSWMCLAGPSSSRQLMAST